MKIFAIDTATDACSAALHLDGGCREIHELAPRRHAEILLPRIRTLLSEAALSLRDLDALAFGRGPGAFTGVRIATGVIQGLAFGADLPVVPVSSLHALAQGAWRERGEENILAAFDARMGEVYWGAYRLDATGDNEEGTLPCAALPQTTSTSFDNRQQPFDESLEHNRRGLACAALVPVVRECVCAPGKVPLPQGPLSEGQSDGWFGVGEGWRTYGEILRREVARRSHGGPPQPVTMEPDRYPHARDIATLAIAALDRGESVAAEHAQPVYLRDRVTR
ncbi:MAG: tRNA threonylcarbamoyladenosine biosynthesis protein TsaB [Candidatus Kentron sp. G]|nr:MAG: tRNA threonylcarbamoyladenosine biosynthesis protein TsaB [Candidatus Kentron sp. G]